ncbi:MAG: cupin domain-containing protein [Dehalococcoidia bacterium]|nr:cupin domain-containing protein [Dehalococcoidia bacterium]MDD5494713.1 cupin domain-containing protein [Dehalococcoidia bacterium]
MDHFPDFMKNPLNAISAQSQSKGIEGYVYDGVDGSQIAFWECPAAGVSAEHVHDFDEYFIVIQGLYILIINSERIPISAGQERHIPGGLPHAGEWIAGTRTLHAFGGFRARRKEQ